VTSSRIKSAPAPSPVSRQDVADLFDRYVAYLDDRRFDDWLNLFTDDCTYTMLLHRDHVQDTNMVAIGEDKRRLQGRIEVGQDVERDLRTHLLTALRIEEDATAIRASSNFAVLRKGAVNCCGRYHMTLRRADGGLRIERCVVVLDNEVILGTIYLPV